MATEKRLIDAHDVPELLEKEFTRKWRLILDGETHLDNLAEGFFSAKSVIWAMPTVDAVVLPCKIGDKVYRIDKGNYHSNWKPFVEELTVTEISWKKEKYGDKDLGFAIIASGIRYKFTSIGKSVFLTRKEAEAKMDGDGNA